MNRDLRDAIKAIQQQKSISIEPHFNPYTEFSSSDSNEIKEEKLKKFYNDYKSELHKMIGELYMEKVDKIISLLMKSFK